jgi:hypothetical protein
VRRKKLKEEREKKLEREKPVSWEREKIEETREREKEEGEGTRINSSFFVPSNLPPLVYKACLNRLTAKP